MAALPEIQKAIRWHPPSYDIRVEDIPIPSLEQPDDAIIKIKLAGLCGSDLHIYRGHEDVHEELVCGHEFIGTVVALGSNFSPSHAKGRPQLYSTLKIGDEVISPFTVSCGECHFCRVGFTCRCIHSKLFGIHDLPGGQAQYVRVPKAGGTLFRIPGGRTGVHDASYLLLGDILPTGLFAVMQLLQNQKIAPMLQGKSWPLNAWPFHPSNTKEAYGAELLSSLPLLEKDRSLTIAVVGLGPVGICAFVSLLDAISETSRPCPVRLVAVDPLHSRREKVQKIHDAMDVKYRLGQNDLVIASIEDAPGVVEKWTDGVGCNGILEVVGNNSALSLAYDLVRPFGIISSVGVHQGPPLPFTGRQVYDKNVSFDFGRCPVRALFPLASEVLSRHLGIFGSVGQGQSLVERIVGFDEAARWYEEFDKGRCGKVVFDPWK
ncbi:hypothetical protein PUNSTDRAFT_116533 [Punctularia strigosozonata HHB-11173 SS5]|uniref:Alcohol dehydrogenase-like N-terminal domain-containing protein n=1 Tax=Punctularia strigosozonata (strain HHB-11173) TaxID=741275 RepID=R7S388_PUNST|nr:uncharacterized protein PUNSTDRAFT_116533 [Punctularia strigosozonata HHB-11173 SS5]EIN04314.1 hypothetical protein PUNSTDRAFT_116533 [Punctularia strigosozonata HHB-11173 SS5]